MQANPITFLDFISGVDKKFTIPVFQRNYDWREEHCKQLFTDICSMVSDSKRKFHFMGTIVYISNDEVDMIDFHEYVVIDGQQRITTVMLLLKAIHDSFKSMGDKENNKIAEKIYDHYLTNKYAESQNKLRLKPMLEDEKVFQLIMEDQFDFIDKKSTMFKNYSLFRNLINLNNSITPRLLEGVKKLLIVYIGLKRGEDNAQLIFESLNSTGLDLTDADLIRNFVLMDKEPQVQEFLFKNYWMKIEKLLTNQQISDFVRDYLTMKLNEIPKKEQVYNSFKKYVFEQWNKDTISDLLEELLFYSYIYSGLVNDYEQDKEIKCALADLRKLKVTVSYPFLMEVYGDYLNNEINKRTLLDVLQLIETYIVRRLICERPTNALSKVFKNLYRDLKSIPDYKYNYYDCLSVILMKKRYSASFPLENELKHAFASKDMYKFMYIRFLLEKLENHNNKEKVTMENLSIEHIMPQNLNSKWVIKLGTNASSIHEKYVHNIGNLTLTASNSELSDKTYEEKKKVYMESRLKLNKGLINIDNWEENEIQKRAMELFHIAKEIWKLPKIKPEFELSNDMLEKEYLTLSDEYDVTGTKPKSFEIIGQSYDIRSWKDFIIKVAEVLYELDPILFETFTRDSDFSGRNCRIISKNKPGLREAYEINLNIFIETNFNANYTLNYIKLMLEKFNFEDDDLKYWVR